MPPAIYLFFCGEDAFKVVFGNDWGVAGQYASVMSIWLLAQFVTAPLTSIFTVLEKQAHGSFFQGLLLLIRIGSLCLGFALDNVLLVISIFAVGSALGYLIMLLWMAAKVKASAVRMLMITVKYFLITIMTIVPLVIAKYLVDGGGVLIASYVLSGVFVMMLYWKLLKAAY